MLSFFRRRREAKEQRIIALLKMNGEMSGADFEAAVGWSFGAIYILLARMEQDGRITSRWGVATAERGWNRPRLYRIGQCQP